MLFNSQKCLLTFSHLQIKVTQSSSASASSTTSNNGLQDNIYDIKDAIVDDELAVDESEEFNTEKAGEIDSSNYSEKVSTNYFYCSS
jgi:hypothetical protein